MSCDAWRAGTIGLGRPTLGGDRPPAWIHDFGFNPGALRMFTHLPSDPRINPHSWSFFMDAHRRRPAMTTAPALVDLADRYGFTRCFPRATARE